MKTKIKSSKENKSVIVQWLTLFFLGISMSLSLHAAQSAPSNMTVNVGSSSGGVGNLALASEGKIVNLYTNGSGNLTVTLKFPATSLSSQVEMSTFLQQKTGSDKLTFQALNSLGAWVAFGSTTGGTTYKRVVLTLPTSVVISGVITIRISSNSGANDFKLDQAILVDKTGSISPPSIASFTASPSSISSGQSSTLSFSATGATSLIINPGNINVTSLSSLVVTPSSTTSYTLTASNSSGNTSASVNVTVNSISTGLKIPAGTKWYWQLQGSINTTINAKVYDIDMYDTSASLIASLKAAGHIVICYYSAGTYENWRPDAIDFPTSALGTNVDGWAGEKWLDIRNTQVRDIMSKRMDLAKSKGCDGLEPDNVDGYTQSSGFALTKADQINYNTFLADQAHSRGMIVALKNAPDLVANLVNSFDFSVAEECFRFNECDSYSPFINQNKAVLSAEYIEYKPFSAATCTQASGLKLTTVYYNLPLDGTVYQPCP